MRRRASWPFVAGKQAVRLVRSRAGSRRIPPMTRIAVLAAAAAVLVLGSSIAVAAPVTQQNGKAPVFKAFTSICAVPGYVNYGNCAGDPDHVHRRHRQGQRRPGEGWPLEPRSQLQGPRARPLLPALGQSDGLDAGARRDRRLLRHRDGHRGARRHREVQLPDDRPEVPRLRPEHPRRPGAAPRHHGRHVLLVGAGPPGAEPGRHAVRPPGLVAVPIEQGPRLFGLPGHRRTPRSARSPPSGGHRPCCAADSGNRLGSLQKLGPGEIALHEVVSWTHAEIPGSKGGVGFTGSG